MKKNKPLELIFHWGSRKSHSGLSIFFQPCWILPGDHYNTKYFTSIKEFNEYEEKNHKERMDRELNWQNAISDNPSLKSLYETFKGSSISIEISKKEPEVKTLADLKKLFKQK